MHLLQTYSPTLTFVLYESFFDLHEHYILLICVVYIKPNILYYIQSWFRVYSYIKTTSAVYRIYLRFRISDYNSWMWTFHSRRKTSFHLVFWKHRGHIWPQSLRESFASIKKKPSLIFNDNLHKSMSNTAAAVSCRPTVVINEIGGLYSVFIMRRFFEHIILFLIFL